MNVEEDWKTPSDLVLIGQTGLNPYVTDDQVANSWTLIDDNSIDHSSLYGAGSHPTTGGLRLPNLTHTCSYCHDEYTISPENHVCSAEAAPMVQPPIRCYMCNHVQTNGITFVHNHYPDCDLLDSNMAIGEERDTMIDLTDEVPTVKIEPTESGVGYMNASYLDVAFTAETEQSNFTGPRNHPWDVRALSSIDQLVNHVPDNSFSMVSVPDWLAEGIPELQKFVAPTVINKACACTPSELMVRGCRCWSL